MRPFDSRTYVCGPFEKTEKARPQCGRHATHSDITSHGIKSPSSPTVPTRLSAADHAPLLGEHVAGPYSNRVLSPFYLLALSLCTLFHQYESSRSRKHRHERDHTDNETTVLRTWFHAVYVFHGTIKSDRFVESMGTNDFVKSINSIEFSVESNSINRNYYLMKKKC